MKCVRCGRALLVPTKTINSRNGPLGWGPVCAMKDGLIQRNPRVRALVAPQEQPPEVDPSQMALELTP